MEIKKILEMCVQYNASDVHIMVGVPPMIRMHGNLLSVPETKAITPSQSLEIVNSLLSEQQQELLKVDRELDFSYSLVNGARFRVNVYFEKGNAAAALRYIPKDIKTLEELHLPEVIGKMTELKQGLVLVTGPTGHGKSTTLAAMIARINSTRSEHIVTVEDPIEYVHVPQKSIISQRELHADTHSWGVALKSVLREDPNVVLIGEMRDYETIEAALTIAETGHLVLATLHTNSASQTIDRIVDVFPEKEQQQIRGQLSLSLEAVISQRLVPSLDSARVAVAEILLATPAVRSLIRDGKSHMLTNVMQTSTDVGMRTLDMALVEAYRVGKISLTIARDYALNSEELNRLVGGSK
ncbi:type IV pili twitching motility protein PilT [Candidatus Collierbacteria bacterium CG09_land_8_20_14_0_10_46_12]|uniref:Type IV pili twitching motility protein PilT n=1 Tax=Candidatus Collierbacteria bacterium CG09_land_8_20_14_0_10_46_12 TaxID=1974533 RepID=A0A2H0WYF6_9BACT|nr:MAG: type IV pili twitching motility protein PilT [Candidatus Collierbacteria bacterium CG09_land_8_20_14_0_10_46_12]